MIYVAALEALLPIPSILAAPLVGAVDHPSCDAYPRGAGQGSLHGLCMAECTPADHTVKRGPCTHSALLILHTSRAVVLKWGYAYPWGYVKAVQGVREIFFK